MSTKRKKLYLKRKPLCRIITKWISGILFEKMSLKNFTKNGFMKSTLKNYKRKIKRSRLKRINAFISKIRVIILFC